MKDCELAALTKLVSADRAYLDCLKRELIHRRITPHIEPVPNSIAGTAEAPTAEMELYDVTNGSARRSYIRVYVWCRSRQQALQLAKEMFLKQCPPDEGQRLPLAAKLLLTASTAPLCTKVSDEGWEV